uniref:glycine cleavage system protein R n=1 Tax=Ningiella ruwaisensis TaxID=2364274 RepID=UPI0010A07E1C|nr:ACT domain-containing protein [Ningiella ruwaisensis]
MQAMVLSVIGKDKPGLVEQISKCISDADGNWLKSSFCHLAGHFAGFVEVMLPKENHNQLIQACHALSNLQITLVPASIDDSSNDKLIRMSVTGNDRKGIVSEISQHLARLNISIQEMETNCDSAPNWGSPIFTADLVLACGQDIDADDIRETIEQITDDLVVELNEGND